MSSKTLTGLKFFGILFLGVGIVYLLYALYALYLCLAGAGLCRFFLSWGGFPFLLLSFFEMRLGVMFLRRIFKDLKLMLAIVFALDALIGYFFMPWVPKALRIGFWLIIYTIAFIYVMRVERS